MKVFLKEAEFFDKDFELFTDKGIDEIVDDINNAGAAIDEDRLDKHIIEYDKIKADAFNDFTTSLMKDGIGASINSRKDILRAFFVDLNLPVLKSTKTGPSLDSETLAALADMHPAVAAYRDFKSAHAMLNTLNNIKQALRDGKVYPHHNLNKTVSGRFSSSGENGDKLNINGWSKKIRDILKPQPDHLVVSFDYKNMEGMVSAALSGQQDLIDDIINDVDTHQKLADILGVDRKMAKIVNHGVNYGMTAFGLARRLGCSEEEAQSFIDKYWAEKDKIHSAKAKIVNMAKAIGYISTISGFKRDITGISSDQIWSTFIQGSAADCFKNALTKVQQYLKSSGNGRVITPMHDCLVCELKTGETFDATVDTIKEIMENIHPKIPFIVSVEIGSW